MGVVFGFGVLSLLCVLVCGLFAYVVFDLVGWVSGVSCELPVDGGLCL